MTFYDILQLDPQANKTLQKNSPSQKETLKLQMGMVLRAILIVLFAVVFISAASARFGSENSPMAVVMFCIILAVRFVDFGYCTRDELTTLGVVFLILLFSPVLACSVSPLIGFFIHAASLLTILVIACDRPEMGNGGLFGFAYIYLCGNPVYGEALVQRFYFTLISLLLCGFIFYAKHKDKNTEIRFLEKVTQLTWTEFKCQWMLRLTLGISAILTLGIALEMERFMWAGFACSSVLSLYSPSPKIQERFQDRLIGAVVGVVVFFCIYHLIPPAFHGAIGPLGGLCLGFCSQYQYKTVLNCLGALLIASEVYGLHYAMLLRITNTVFGLVFAVGFLYVYERCVSARFVPALLE